MAQVEIDNVAILTYINKPGGPIANLLEKQAAKVDAAAKRNASGPILGVVTGDLLQFMVPTKAAVDNKGLVVKIGSTSRHDDENNQTPDGFAYPGWHDRHGRPWLSNALREVFKQ